MKRKLTLPVNSSTSNISNPSKKVTRKRPTELLILAGSYERLLYGLTLSEPSFIYPSHISSISTITATEKFLFTGSSDEQIKVYSLGMRKEIGVIGCHVGSVTRVLTVSNSYVVSSGEDGFICLTRMSDWETVKILKGHKGGVLDISVHGSGKVLMSIGKDQTLKTWDLVRGLLSFSLTLISPTSIQFSKCGLYYLIGYDKKIEIYDMDGTLKTTIISKTRINRVKTAVLSVGSVVIYAGEDRILSISDMTGNSIIKHQTRHKLRIKDLDILHESRKLVSCSSEGLIIMWDLESLVGGKGDEAEEYSYDARCRLTCVSVVMAQKPRKVKVEILQSGGESEVEELQTEKVTVTME